MRVRLSLGYTAALLIVAACNREEAPIAGNQAETYLATEVARRTEVVVKRVKLGAGWKSFELLLATYPTSMFRLRASSRSIERFQF